MRRLSVGVWLCGMVAILLLLLRPCEPEQRGVEEVAQPEAAIGEKSEGGGVARRLSVSHSEVVEETGKACDTAATGARLASAADAADALTDETPPTPAELAIEAWHVLLGSLRETEAISDDVTEMQPRVYAAFIALSAKDRPEAISHAMNLLPDDAVGAVYGILFDPAQPAEVLNTIFDDVLNRDERIKDPVIRAISDNPAHPLAGDAIRILSVVGDEHE